MTIAAHGRTKEIKEQSLNIKRAYKKLYKEKFEEPYRKGWMGYRAGFKGVGPRDHKQVEALI